MNWGAIGAISELVGAAAVVLSLVYLARQIHANTKSTAVAATSAYLQGFGQLNVPIMQSREFAETFNRGYFGYDELDETERFQFQVAFAQWFYLWDSMFTLHREGLLPEARWNAIRTMIENSLALPGPRSVWLAIGRDIVNADLVREIEGWPTVKSSLFENLTKSSSELLDEASTERTSDNA